MKHFHCCEASVVRGPYIQSSTTDSNTSGPGSTSSPGASCMPKVFSQTHTTKNEGRVVDWGEHQIHNLRMIY